MKTRPIEARWPLRQIHLLPTFMQALRLSILLPLVALGAVLAKPLVTPKPEARRLEVLGRGERLVNHSAAQRNAGEGGSKQADPRSSPIPARA